MHFRIQRYQLSVRLFRLIRHYPLYSIVVSKGSHGEEFVPRSDPRFRRGLNTKEKQIVDQLDGFFGETTAAKAYSKLLECLGEEMQCSQLQVENYIHNRRKMLREGLSGSPQQLVYHFINVFC